MSSKQQRYRSPDGKWEWDGEKWIPFKAKSRRGLLWAGISVAVIIIGLIIASATTNGGNNNSTSTTGSKTVAQAPAKKTAPRKTTPSPVAPAPTQKPATPAPAPKAAAPAPAPKPQQPQVFTITCTGNDEGNGIDITYGTDSSNTQGPSTLNGTWTTTVPVDSTNEYYDVNAQLQGSGTVSCTLTAPDGTTKTAAANGGYNIALAEISKGLFGGYIAD